MNALSTCSGPAATATRAPARATSSGPTAAVRKAAHSTGSGLPAGVQRAAEKATLELPFRIPAKDWFSLGEAAALCGMGETFMEKLFDAAEAQGRGEIFGHKHNAGAGARMTKRIPRLFVIAYMIKTATYDNEALVDTLIASLRTCSPDQQRRVHSALGLFLEKR